MNKTIAFITLLFLTFWIPALSGADRHPAGNVSGRMDKTCQIPSCPRRVVALAPSISEIICEIGREDCLKGVTLFSDYPESVKKLPKVGSYVRLDLESILALSPDLCIGVKDGNPDDTLKRLENLGIPVLVVNPCDLNSVIRAIEDIGHVLNVAPVADRIVMDIRKRIDHVRSFTENFDHRPRVFFQIGVSPIVSVGQGSFLDELIEAAGGNNLAGNAKGYPRFSREAVLSLNPDVIIITSMARGEIFEAVKKQWESWPDLQAVKRDQVYIVDSDILDRPSPRMVEGLELLTALIHPGFLPLETAKRKDRND